MLKKNVSTSRKLADLETDAARLLWTWLLPHLDVAGRFSGEPDVVKGSVVPRLKHMTVEMVDIYLEELDEAGLIRIYTVDGERYLELCRFEDFQNLRTDHEAESKIPKPPKNKEDSNSGSSPGVLREFSGHLEDKDKDKDEDKDKPEDAGSDIILTQLLIELMLLNNPESAIIKKLTPKRKAEWVRSCRLLREADSRTPEQIEAVIRFSQDDDFWKSNILCMPKLREKWDQLWMKAKNPGRWGESRVSQIGKSDKKADAEYWAERLAKEKELRASGLDEAAIRAGMVEWSQESYDRRKAKEAL